MKRCKTITTPDRKISEIKEKLIRKGRSYIPTAKDERLVGALCMIGLSHERIAFILGISMQTLRKFYFETLSSAHHKASAAVVKSLYDKAVGGDVQACMFWLKCREGWGIHDNMRSVGNEGDNKKYGVLMACPVSEFEAIQKENNLNGSQNPNGSSSDPALGS